MEYSTITPCRAVIGALQDVTRSQGFDINIDKCLPRPSMPNYYIYFMITCTLQLCYILVYIQAYMLRLRRYIMSRSYPERERQRIIYLRRKILNNRGIGNVEDLKKTIRNAANEVEKNRSRRILSFRGAFVKWSNRRGVSDNILSILDLSFPKLIAGNSRLVTSHIFCGQVRVTRGLQYIVYTFSVSTTE